MYRLARNIS